MKKLSLLFCIVYLWHYAGQAQSSQAEQQASRIAQRMSDSLSLTSAQKDGIYAISLDLINQSQAVFAQSPADSLQPRLQRIENKRDPLYLPVLGNEKYLLYKQRKRTLVYGN